MLWMMFTRGPGSWKYIKAEAPCWKGEVGLSFWLFSMVVGWQRQAA